VNSASWLQMVNVLSLVGAGLAGLAAAGRLADPSTRTGRYGRLLGRLLIPVLILAILATSASVWNRYIEVNHFPSQTMGEVLVMFSSALLVSMLALHYALKLERIGPRWAMVDDGLLLLVFVGVVATNHYAGTLSSAQRDLPPALQSYWFPPHLVALIFSYATMGIAGLACIGYFAVRFWQGLFCGGRTKLSQWVVLGGMLCIPFVQVVTAPILVAVGLVFVLFWARGKLPTRDDLGSLEKTMDEVSYRAFSVGIPFLTAGLFMGAFWAQEAWANYWGWDSKENSALISWLVYVLYIHLRMLGGYRGEKAMAVLAGGALSVFLTFQIFGYLPDSQKSLHRYTDDGVVPQEGMLGSGPEEQ